MSKDIKTRVSNLRHCNFHTYTRPIYTDNTIVRYIIYGIDTSYYDREDPLRKRYVGYLQTNDTKIAQRALCVALSIPSINVSISDNDRTIAADSVRSNKDLSKIFEYGIFNPNSSGRMPKDHNPLVASIEPNWTIIKKIEEGYTYDDFHRENPIFAQQHALSIAYEIKRRLEEPSDNTHKSRSSRITREDMNNIVDDIHRGVPLDNLIDDYSHLTNHVRIIYCTILQYQSLLAKSM